MRNKILLDKIAHRYNLNGIELNEKVIATCNSLKPGMYRIHWRDNMVYRLEELKGYNYSISGGYYHLLRYDGFYGSKTLELASSEFIDLKLDEVRNNIIDQIFE
jgi:hypothetical protein